MAEISQTLAIQLGQLRAQRDRYASAPVESFAGEYSPSGEYIGRNPEAMKAATVSYYDRQIQNIETEIATRKAYEASPAYEAEQRGFAEQQNRLESERLGYDVTEQGSARDQSMQAQYLDAWGKRLEGGSSRLQLENELTARDVAAAGLVGRSTETGFEYWNKKNTVLEAPYPSPRVDYSYMVFDKDTKTPVLALTSEQKRRMSPRVKQQLDEYGVTWEDVQKYREPQKGALELAMDVTPATSALFGRNPISTNVPTLLRGVQEGMAKYGSSPTEVLINFATGKRGSAFIEKPEGLTFREESAALALRSERKFEQDVKNASPLSKATGLQGQYAGFRALGRELDPRKETAGGLTTSAFVGGVAFAQAGALASGVIAKSSRLSGVAATALRNPKATEAATVALFGGVAPAINYGYVKATGGSEAAAQEAFIQGAGKFAAQYPTFKAGAEIADRLPQIGYRVAEVPVTKPVIKNGKIETPAVMKGVAEGFTLEYNVGAKGDAQIFGGESTRRVAQPLLVKGEETGWLSGYKVGRVPYENMPTIKTYAKKGLLTVDETAGGAYQFQPRGAFETTVLTSEAGLKAQGFKPVQIKAVQSFIEAGTYTGAQPMASRAQLPKRTKLLTPKATETLYDVVGRQGGGVDRLQGSFVFKPQLKTGVARVYRSPKDVDIALKTGEEPAVYAQQLGAALKSARVRGVKVQEGRVLIRGQKAVEYIKPDLDAQFLYGLPQSYYYGFKTPQTAISGITPKGKRLPIQRAQEQIPNFGSTLFGYYSGRRGITLGVQAGRTKDFESLYGLYATTGTPKSKTQGIRSYARSQGANYPKLEAKIGWPKSVSISSSRPTPGGSFYSSRPSSSSRSWESSFSSYSSRPSSFSSSRSSSSLSSLLSSASSSSSRSSSSSSSSRSSSSSSRSSSSSFSSYSSRPSSSSSSSSSSSFFTGSTPPVAPPTLPFGIGGFGGFGGNYRGKRTKGIYAPSLVGLLSKPKRGRAPSMLTGFETRYVLKRGRK